MEDTENESEKEDRILPAKELYLLMKKDYRISRNTRAAWFFHNINSVLRFFPQSCLEETNKELTIVSVICDNDLEYESEEVEQLKKSQTEAEKGFQFQLVPSTVLHFIAKRYRLVFVLDFSPSVLSVDLKTGEVLADKIFGSLKKCLSGLVKPFLLPGTNLLFDPELFITVIAHTPMVACTANQVLVQGIHVTPANLDSVLETVKTGLQLFEQNLYQDINNPSSEMARRSRNKSADSPINPEAGIINLLRQGFFALQLLPENSSAGIIVVTDGMLGVTDLSLFETLINQLRSSTIACSFLRIGQTHCVRCSFGFVPHEELLHFIATATFGTYMADSPNVEAQNQFMNDYHRKLLLWSFQKGLNDGFKFAAESTRLCTYMDVYAHPLKSHPHMMPIIRKKHADNKLNTKLSSVLSVRLREGYTIKSVNLIKGGTQIKVELVLPWRDYVKIEYCATAAWPTDTVKNLTHIEITVEGIYEFLHDAFSNECAFSQRRWSVIRINSVKKFLVALQRLLQSDQLLTHLQSFSTNPSYYKLPDVIKGGASVFDNQHNQKDTVLNHFAVFWKPVVNLDTKIWQKWMHSHKISMVLEHDRPLPKHLHIPDSCGRFYFVSCRQAHASLQKLLQSWCTFVLIENTAYIKYLYEGDSLNSQDKVPSHFLLLRLSSKFASMTIKAAFLGGTSGGMRYKVLKDLKAKVFSLTFKQAGLQVDKRKRAPQTEDKKVNIRKPPLDRDCSEIPCCILLTKPMENILISYERVPHNMTILEDPSKFIPIHMPVQQINNKATLANAFNTLSRYLHHQRWIWTIKQGKVDISMQAVGRILSTLTKIRLQEGFHFASSNSGIVNMVLETDMKDPIASEERSTDVSRCVVQYIMFPPHIKTSCSSMSEDELDLYELTEADGELQIVTECWVEPQHGVVINSSPERQHWEGLTYRQIARAFYPKDLECVSSLVTFENLQYVCQHPIMFNDLPWQGEGSDPASSFLYENETHKGGNCGNIHQMPLMFDILSLVTRSQQVEIQFSSFVLAEERDENLRDIKGSNNLLMNLLFEKLRENNETEIPLSVTDCRKYMDRLLLRPRDTAKYPYPFEVNAALTDSLTTEHSKTDLEKDSIPMWKCFVHSANPNRIFLTFTPASYEDILKLHNVTLDVKNESIIFEDSPETHSTEKDSSNDSDLEKDVKKGQNLEREEQAYVIPVYMYECFLSNITDSLINPWCFTLTPDIYEDLTFEIFDLSEETCSIKSPMFKKPSFDLSALNSSDAEVFTENHLTRENNENNENTTDVWSQITHFSELYYSSFVHGVFQSLQQGFYVSQHDIDAAINNICEETNPIEIDMTSFLHASCRHFQQLIEGVKTDTVCTEITEQNDGLKRPPSVRFADEIEGDTPVSSFPSVLHFPKGVIKLMAPHIEQCEYTTGLHNLVQSKFTDIVQKWFKVVPTAPDFYFYCPESVPVDSSNEESDNKNISDNSDVLKSDQLMTEELLDDSMVFQEPDNEQDMKYNNPDLISIASQLDSQESLDESDEYDFCGDIVPNENDDDSAPLFLHFTCTVKSGMDNENISVQKLVPCIENLASKEITSLELNLGELKITLDILCLTYPVDVEPPQIRKPSFVRMFSNTSYTNGQSPRTSEYEQVDVPSTIDTGFGHSSGGDPIAHLPLQQHNAIIKCKEELEWLLKDEIASSLQHMLPIKEDALQFVIEHIKHSAEAGKPTCSFESVPLHFVYGSEHSLAKFQEEFQRVHLHGYRLIKEGDYYFAVRLKNHGIGHHADAQALTSALVELSKDGTPVTQSLSLDSLAADDNYLSTEAGVLRTYVSPVFLSQEFSGSSSQGRKHRHCSSEVNFSDEFPSPTLNFNKLSEVKAELDTCSKRNASDQKDQSSEQNKSGSSRRSSKDSEVSHTSENSHVKSRHSSDTGRNHIKATKDATSDALSNLANDTSDRVLGKPPIQPGVRSASIGDILPDNVLKKSSSFAGFQNEEGPGNFLRQESEASVLSISPLKPLAHLPALGRLRHSSAPSGQGTPRSKTSTQPQTPSWISSRGSFTEGEGYDGGSSDSEDGTTAFSDFCGQHQPVPKFWMILQVKNDRVDIYYHCRETGQAAESEDRLEQRKLLTGIKRNVESLSRKVNQLLLLNDLYETHMCKNLLVAEADEDVSWNVDIIPGKPPSIASDEEDYVYPEQQYLAAESKYYPGHFACEIMMTFRFLVHPRLKTGSGRSSVNRGVQALRTVLNKFSVNNRKNMFVLKETGDSPSGAVFYLRLKEIGSSALSRQVSCISTEDMALCDSASSGMFAARRDEMNHLIPEKEADSVSMTSVGSNSQRPAQDVIEIDIHGVQVAGTKFQTNLLEMLQNRLDDAVLDIISLQLTRNPILKLMPEDVHFIQKPHQDTNRMILLTIPSQLSIPLPALLFYLKQNMSQFSHTPNYADNKHESRFQDRIFDKWQPIPDDQVYLYIRPQSSGGKGIACISVTLVDGRGNPVKLLCCQKPSRTNYTMVETLEDFDAVTHTEIFNSTPSHKPGPTALVQFRIWERGCADLDTLQEKLIGAMRHALCDVITEYYFLTTSICPVPQQLHELLPAPALSAPTSPIVLRDPLERRPSGLSRKNSIDTIKVLSGSKNLPDQAYSQSPLQYVKEVFGSKQRLMSPPPDSTKTFTIPDTSTRPSPSPSPAPPSDKHSEIQQIVRMYEEGERGSLCPILTDQMASWFDYCHRKGVPAITKLQQTFQSRIAVNQFLTEFQTTVKTVSTGNIWPKIFKLHCDTDGNLCCGIQYNPSRKALHAEESHVESSLDYNMRNKTEIGGTNIIVIGRHIDQWLASVQDFGEEELVEITMRQNQKENAFQKQSCQRFAPYLSEKNNSDYSNDALDSMDLSPGMETVFIPRQRLLFMKLKNREFTLYTYNWAGDLNNSLIKSTIRLVHWHNARMSLTKSIVVQKMGLFHHCHFHNQASSKEKNPFTGSNTNLDDLIKNSAPPSDKPRRNNSMSVIHTQQYRAFDEVYKDLHPMCPLQRTEWIKITSDVIKQQGSQTQDLRLHDKKEMEKLQKLNNLFLLWMGKSSGSMAVKDDLIQLLKQASRLLHYCATPLLFDPCWRQKVMKKYEVTQRQTSVSSNPDLSEKKVRSRHSSGQSVASLRVSRCNSQGQDGKKKGVSTPADSPVNYPKHHKEEQWHIDLRHSFMNQYIQYVQSLGFVMVNVQSPSNMKGTHRKKPSFERITTHEGDVPHIQISTFYLHKAMPAGIMLMELSFREQYFCVELYVSENTRLGLPVNKHLKLLFVDECEKCKDLIHVHSFAHDFHLRCIQSCMQYSRDIMSLFRPNYHLTSFLKDFMHVYPYPPKFSRNYLFEDTLIITELSSPGSNLFDFMVANVKHHHDFKVFQMTPNVDADIDQEYCYIKANEYALVQQKSASTEPLFKGSKQQNEDYLVGLVITHDSQGFGDLDRNSLRLRYFIILTSQQKLFPKEMPEIKTGEFKAMVLQEIADLSKPVKQHISVRKEVRKHQSKSKIYNISAYNLLMEEAKSARDKMCDMVEKCKVKCRKDSLWQRMAISDQADDDFKRRKRSETEESKDGFQKLMYEEFLELLGMAEKVTLDTIDPLLIPFLNMCQQWYTGLYKKLQSKYPDTHRCFSSQDGQVQYIVILNPNYLDMFSMLMINSKENRTFLGAVYRDYQTEEVTAENPSLPVRSIHSHMEDFINVCSYHLWSSML